MIADGRGRAVTFRIAPGQAHELPHAIPLLDRLPGVPKWVVGDRGYSSHGFREHIWTTGARPAIPTKRNEEQLACPDWVYNNRNIVERLWAPQGVARRRQTLREDRRQLRRCPLPRRNARLAQVTTRPGLERRRVRERRAGPPEEDRPARQPTAKTLTGNRQRSGTLMPHGWAALKLRLKPHALGRQ